MVSPCLESSMAGTQAARLHLWTQHDGVNKTRAVPGLVRNVHRFKDHQVKHNFATIPVSLFQPPRVSGWVKFHKLCFDDLSKSSAEWHVKSLKTQNYEHIHSGWSNHLMTFVCWFDTNGVISFQSPVVNLWWSTWLKKSLPILQFQSHVVDSQWHTQQTPLPHFTIAICDCLDGFVHDFVFVLFLLTAKSTLKILTVVFLSCPWWSCLSFVCYGHLNRRCVEGSSHFASQF